MSDPAVPTVVIHPFQPPGLKNLLADLEGARWLTPTDDEIAGLLSEADALVTYLWEDDYLVPGLGWVQAVSAGTDHFPVGRLREEGVVLTSARGAHSPAVADHAVALLLAMVRRLGPAVRRSALRQWQPEVADEMEDMTVAIVGLGSIGEAVARRLGGWGITVIGCKRDPSRHEGNVQEVVGVERLDEVLARCDAAILTLPHTEETKGMIGADRLEALGGWLVNVGRGSVVDEAALVKAIGSGKLRGAALDVTAVEPLPAESPLWEMEEVIVTPHMAWASHRLARRLADIIEVNLSAWRGEAEWLNRVTS